MNCNPHTTTNRRAASRATLLGLLCAVCVLAWVATSHAQVLDMTAGQAPGPNECQDSIELSRRLTAEAIVNGRGAAKTSDPATRDFLRARAAVRAFAASLLYRGEELGEAGSSHVYAGRRIAASIDAIDTCLASSLTADQRESISLFIAIRAESHGVAIPAAPSDLRALCRDTLAPLVRACMPTLVIPACASSDPLDAIRAHLTPEAGAAWESFVTETASASSWWAFAREVEWLHDHTVLALTAATTLPEWVAPDARERMLARLSAAVIDVTRIDRRAASLVDLACIATLSTCVHHTSELDLPPADAARVRRTMNTLLSASDPAQGVRDTRSLAALRRAISLVHARHTLSRTYEDAPGRPPVPPATGESRRIPSELRPLWRALENEAVVAERALLEALPEIAASASALTEPALVAHIATVARTTSRLESIASLVSLIEQLRGGAEPKSDTERERAQRSQLVSTRTLALAKSFQSPERRDQSLDAILRIAALSRHVAAIRNRSPAPESLRSHCGDRAPDILTAFDVAFDAYLDAWGRKGESRAAQRDPTMATDNEQSAARRLNALASLVELALDARDTNAALAAGGVHSADTLWLSNAARGRLIDAQRAAIEPLVRDVLTAPDDVDVHARIQRAAADAAITRIIARLDRESRSTTTVAPPVPPLAQAAGLSVWLARACEVDPDVPTISRDIALAASIAALAKALEEWHDAAARSDAAAASRWLSYARRVAEEFPAAQ
jgi:hypothetical protein